MPTKLRKLPRWVSTCDECDWESNPHEQEDEAVASLDFHKAEAHPAEKPTEEPTPRRSDG